MRWWIIFYVLFSLVACSKKSNLFTTPIRNTVGAVKIVNSDGFIGAIRYFNQIKLLIEASKETETNVLFAGQAIDPEFIENLENSIKLEASALS
jgi:hypothetical protein